jgi:hypothetical protein
MLYGAERNYSRSAHCSGSRASTRCRDPARRVGATAKTLGRAVVLAAISMLLGVSVYYALMRVFEAGVNLSYFMSITIIWVLAAPIAGMLFGMAGSLWRNRGVGGLNQWAGPAAVGATAGMVAGESVFLLQMSSEISPGSAFILGGFLLFGMVLPVVLLSLTRELMVGYAATVLFLLLGMASIPVVRSIVERIEQSGFQAVSSWISVV